MSLLKDAIEFLHVKGHAAAKPEVLTLEDNRESVRKLVVIDGKSTEYEVSKERQLRGHAFDTLESFLTYMATEACDDEGVIFIQDDVVRASLSYGKAFDEIVYLPLEESEEFTALRTLMGGVKQKALWRLLVTDLSASFPEDLAAYIAVLNVRQSEEERVEIDVTGVMGRSGDSRIGITYPRIGESGQPASATIPVRWTFRGRLWRCFDQEVEIPLRLEIHTNGGLTFQFHPERLNTLIDSMRAALKDRIAGTLAGDSKFTVFVGEYDPE